MTLTPERRRRAVEVMARGLWNAQRALEFDPAWSSLNKRERAAFLADAGTCLTALLTVADVTWKENGDGRSGEATAVTRSV